MKILICRASTWSKGCTLDLFSHGNIIDWLWMIWVRGNDRFFQTTPDTGNQQGVTLLQESICIIPFQAKPSDIMRPKVRHYSSNCVLPHFINGIGIFLVKCDQPNKNLCTHFRWAADINSNNITGERKWSGMLIAQKIAHQGVIWCTNQLHNRCAASKLILYIPPPIASGHLTIHSNTLSVSNAHQFKLEVYLKSGIC